MIVKTRVTLPYLTFFFKNRLNTTIFAILLCITHLSRINAQLPPRLTNFEVSDCSEVFISEYIEGSNPFDVSIEIYNPSASAKQLSDYVLKIYKNGANTLIEIPLSLDPNEMINPYETYVISNANANANIFS